MFCSCLNQDFRDLGISWIFGMVWAKVVFVFVVCGGLCVFGMVWAKVVCVFVVCGCLCFFGMVWAKVVCVFVVCGYFFATCLALARFGGGSPFMFIPSADVFPSSHAGLLLGALWLSESGFSGFGDLLDFLSGLCICGLWLSESGFSGFSGFSEWFGLKWFVFVVCGCLNLDLVDWLDYWIFG